MDRLDALWASLRTHPAFRVGAVYAGVSWVLVQAAEIFGFSTGTIRAIGAVLALGFVALVAGLSLHHAGRLRAARDTGAVLAPHALLRGRRLTLTVGVLLVLGTGAWFAAPRMLRGTVAPGADRIAVLPFSASGVGVSEFGEGMVDLLSTSLDQVGGIGTIHPRTVLHRWRDRAGGTGMLDLDGSIRLGQDVEAGSVLLGSITGTGNEVVLQAELYSTAGERLAQVSTTGSPDAILALVDDLSVRLLREIWRSSRPIPQLRVSGITTSSMEALRAYLAGERHYRAARWDSARVAFERATEADTLFALAYLRLGESIGWATGHGNAAAVAAAERSVALADRLPERERALARLHLMHERAEPAALDSAAAYVARYPDDAMGWYLLGDVRFHARNAFPQPDSALLGPFERLMELDNSLALALVHPIEHALQIGDSVRHDGWLERYAAMAPAADVELRRLARRVRFAPADELASVYVEALRGVLASAAGDVGAQNRALARVNAGIAAAFVLRADVPAWTLMTMADSTAAYIPGQGDAQRTAALLGLGRAEEARRLMAAEPAGPAAGLAFWAAAVGVAPRSIIDALDIPDPLIERYSERAVALGGGDLAAARRVEIPAPDSALLTSAPEVEYAMAGLRIWERMVEGDTLGALAARDSLLREAGFASRTLGWLGPFLFHTAVAESRLPTTRAKGMLRIEAMLLQQPILIGPLYLALAEAREAAGDPAGAAEAYAHVLRVWEGADPHLQPAVEGARRALARLSGET